MSFRQTAIKANHQKKKAGIFSSLFLKRVKRESSANDCSPFVPARKSFPLPFFRTACIPKRGKLV
jgi:hypothetical protein